MADFKSALEALKQGELKLADLSQQLHKLLTGSPAYAGRFLVQLDEALAEGLINDDTYTLLKRQINQFRRAHAATTENGNSGDSDATVFERADDNDEDKTRADDNTAVDHDTNDFMADVAAEDRAATGASGSSDTAGVDFDISSLAGEDSSSPSLSDSSFPSSPSQQSWTPPGAQETPELSGLGPGSIIKDRFILDEVLGSGGMGKVYKGRDLLKVEAKDRNPYVALKVLNEDFKEHPEAFIALQRESSRQQRLAHPNIATVYDFDRIGKSGTSVFITMELMEGYPLNTYIKKQVKPQNGLPFNAAYPIIKQLCAALAYAHKQNIVHSDFKPGNAFLCNDGTVKVLDFGIARAVKNPLAGEGAEKTLFDPSKLGALTPAYASLEMLQGEEPDTRDDIYALACVAYELLTGRHPFNKLPANSAKENNLLPAPVKGLTRRQMKGLMRGLAFERSNRSPNVETFLEELEGKANWHKNPWVISAAVLLTLGISLTGPTLNYFHEQKINELISRVQSGQPAAIESVLSELDELSSGDRNIITDKTRDTIQSYFEQQINNEIDPATETYNFKAAREHLQRAEALYPDSASLRAIATRLSEARDQRLYELNKLYIAALENNKLIPGESENDIADVTRKIAQIDPNHPLLEDPRLFNAYGLAAADELKLGNFDKAQEYIDAGLALAPEDTGLVNLQDRLNAAIEQQQRQERIAELQKTIATDLGETVNNVADLKPLQDNIVELAGLSPTDPLLQTIQDKARPAVDSRIENILSEGDRAEAESFSREYGELLQALQFNRELVRVNLAHLDGSAREAAITRLVDENQQAIQSLLTADKLDQVWETELQNHLQELAVLLPADSGELQQARSAVADLLSGRAQTLQASQRYSEALGLLERGERLLPDSQSLAAIRQEVAAAETEFLREREEAARQARIAGLKETLLIQARAKDVNSARQTYTELQAELPADDQYMTETAPNALAEAYSKLAESRAEQGDMKRAKELARAGMEMQPDNQTLSRAMAEYTVAANSEELDQIFANAIGFDVADVSAKVQELREYAPDSYGQLEQRYVKQIANRIRTLQEADPTSAIRLANNASRVFPGNSTLQRIQDELAPQPWAEGDNARSLVEAGRLSQANVKLASALATNPDHPEVVEFRDNLESRIKQADQSFDQYQAALRANELEQAKQHLQQARELWSDNPDYNEAAGQLDARIAAAKTKRESRVLQREVDIAAIEGDAARQEASEEQVWQPIASDRVCSTRLAGYGRRARAICYDLIHERIRGPLMVVVPANGEQSSFAIGKYEVSINDYNKYCYLSGNCKVEDVEDKNAPKSGLTLAEARAYTEWLSERTGKKYRLPTVEEWEYAANAGGEQPRKDFNCRVTLGDSVLKGTGPVSVTVGRQNGWGLKNYIGNVQEWVTNGNSVVARGGSYQDAHSKCDITLEHEQNGAADELTGFRLLLEDVQDVQQG